MQTRSFQYVDDLLEGMLRMMNTGIDITGPLSIGNQKEFSMLELAKIILDITGSSSKLINKPFPQDDPKQRKPYITLAKEYLSRWEQKVQLQEGLEKTIAYFESFPKSSEIIKFELKV